MQIVQWVNGMSIHYNQKAKKITSSDIYSITLYNVVMTKNFDESGGFVFEGYHNTGGCGTAQDSGILILLKDNINWSKICFKWEGYGTASCWSFMDASTNYGAATGTPTANILSYSENLGDRLHDNYLTWEIQQYQSHNRTTACNNNADNFFRFNSTKFKKFRMTRRRNINGNLAGIHHGRSCNTVGTSAITRISDIFVW